MDLVDQLVGDGEDLAAARGGDDELGSSVNRVVAVVGDVVAIDGGREHTIRNESGAPAQAYVVFTPGDPAERFLRAAAELADAGPPDIAEVLATAERHGVQITRQIPA